MIELLAVFTGVTLKHGHSGGTALTSLIISSPVIRDFIRKNNSTVVGPPVLVYVGGPPSLSSLVVRASLNVNE